MAISMSTGDVEKMNALLESTPLSSSPFWRQASDSESTSFGQQASESELEDLSPSDLHPSQSAHARVLRAQRLLLEADAVFFDVDSTVVKSEGIDLLGKCFGVMQEISALTNSAMNGNMTFEDAMAQRLELMADNGMTEKALAECVKTEVQAFSDRVQEVVKRFKARGVDVYLVSGGCFNMIAPIADILDISQGMVYATRSSLMTKATTVALIRPHLPRDPEANLQSYKKCRTKRSTRR